MKRLKFPEKSLGSFCPVPKSAMVIATPEPLSKIYVDPELVFGKTFCVLFQDGFGMTNVVAFWFYRKTWYAEHWINHTHARRGREHVMADYLRSL